MLSMCDPFKSFVDFCRRFLIMPFNRFSIKFWVNFDVAVNGRVKAIKVERKLLLTFGRCLASVRVLRSQRRLSSSHFRFRTSKTPAPKETHENEVASWPRNVAHGKNSCSTWTSQSKAAARGASNWECHGLPMLTSVICFVATMSRLRKLASHLAAKIWTGVRSAHERSPPSQDVCIVNVA
jgi:hypothetical protein